MKKLTPAIIILVVVVGGLIYLNGRKSDLYKDAPQASVEVEPKKQAQPATGSSGSGEIKSVSSSHVTVGEVITVSYTSKGFVPFITEVPLGKSVRFVNNRTDRALWVVSTHPQGSKEFYPGFSGAKSLKKGESFTLPFTKIGAWSYKNLNDASHQGVILVR